MGRVPDAGGEPVLTQREGLAHLVRVRARLRVRVRVRVRVRARVRVRVRFRVGFRVGVRVRVRARVRVRVSAQGEGVAHLEHVKSGGVAVDGQLLHQPVCSRVGVRC